jgi:hypothetical protein
VVFRRRRQLPGALNPLTQLIPLLARRDEQSFNPDKQRIGWRRSRPVAGVYQRERIRGRNRRLGYGKDERTGAAYNRPHPAIREMFFAPDISSGKTTAGASDIGKCHERSRSLSHGGSWVSAVPYVGFWILAEHEAHEGLTFAGPDDSGTNRTTNRRLHF